MASASSSEDIQPPFDELWLLEEATMFKAVIRASARAESSRDSSKAHLGEIDPTITGNQKKRKRKKKRGRKSSETIVVLLRGIRYLTPKRTKPNQIIQFSIIYPVFCTVCFLNFLTFSFQVRFG